MINAAPHFSYLMRGTWHNRYYCTWQFQTCGSFFSLRLLLPYSGLFSKGFYFRIFRRCLFCENKFLGPTVIQKCILMIKLNACSHSRDYIIFAEWMHFVTLSIFQVVAALKQHNKWPSKSVPFLADLCKYLLRWTKQFWNIFNWNIFINVIVTRCLFLFTTELIVSAIFNSNSNARS